MWSQKEFHCLTYNHTHTSVLQFLFPKRKMWWFLTGRHHFHMLWVNNGNNFFFPLFFSWSCSKIWRPLAAWTQGVQMNQSLLWFSPNSPVKSATRKACVWVGEILKTQLRPRGKITHVWQTSTHLPTFYSHINECCSELAFAATKASHC